MDIAQMWKQIVETSGNKQKHLFLAYCKELIRLKESGVLTEEEVACKIIGGFRYDSILKEPKFEDLFDIASDAELPRTSSYRQNMDNWDAKTADKIKQKEWKQLIEAVDCIEM